MSAPLVEVADVTKDFRSGTPFSLPWQRRIVEVLKGASFMVDEGDYLALLGANGAGKTTLLKMVATLLLPDTGHVSVGGYDVRREAARARGDVGYVLADERSFHWRLPGWENLLFFARLDGLPGRESGPRIRYLLERLDLASAGRQPFGQYSTGMKQRLAVARALLKRPRVLLMDEPTRSIDAGHAAAAWDLVRDEVTQAGGCVVVVTHQIEEALRVCNRVAILSNGSIALDTTARATERMTADTTGFTVAVRGVPATSLTMLQSCDGVRDVRLASHCGGEQVFEVWTTGGSEPLPAVLDVLSRNGGTVSSLERAIPLQGVIERFIAANGATDGVPGRVP